MHLLVGLGNPGLRYKKTRHNIGFMVIDKLVSQHEVLHRLRKKRSYLQAGLQVGPGQAIIAAKPLTYMNRSGDAVVELLHQFDVPLNNLLIIVDDVALPFGKVRLRAKGTTGGHNGLKSVIAQLQSESFPRLRIGVGVAEPIADTSGFVLGKFKREEKKQLPSVLQRAADVCMSFVTNGITETMNEYN